MPEESTGPRSEKETPQERLEARLSRLEQEMLGENRWWRGGLIAALVLIALAIFLAPRHPDSNRMFMAATGGPSWGGPGGMPYGGFGPYPGLPPRPGWDRPCGPPGTTFWGPSGGQPRQWGGGGPRGPQNQPPPGQ